MLYLGKVQPQQLCIIINYVLIDEHTSVCIYVYAQSLSSLVQLSTYIPFALFDIIDNYFTSLLNDMACF